MGSPQQRTLPDIHSKDDKFALIYHMVKNTSENKPDDSDDVDARFAGHELAKHTSDLFQVS